MENFREGAESAEREELLRLLRNPELRELAKLEISRYESEEAQRRRQEVVDERTARRKTIAERIDVDLTLGEPSGNNSGPRGQEVLGVYYGGKFIENISNGDPMRVMTDGELANELNRVYVRLIREGLAKTPSIDSKIGGNETPLELEIVIDEETRKLLESHEVTLDTENRKLLLSRDRQYRVIDLYDDGANQRISFTKKDEDTVVITLTEKSGRVISYDLVNGEFRFNTRQVLQNPRR